MGAIKAFYFKQLEAQRQEDFTPSPTVTKTYRGYTTAVADLVRMIQVLRSDITDMPGATGAHNGDYSPACSAALDQCDAIEQKLEKL